MAQARTRQAVNDDLRKILAHIKPKERSNYFIEAGYVRN